MFGFEYTYMSSFDILAQMNKIHNFSTMQYILTIVGVIIIAGLIFFIIPYINAFVVTKAKENEKIKKKQLMDRIVLQKNIEDVIARELKEKSNLID